MLTFLVTLTDSNHRYHKLNILDNPVPKGNKDGQFAPFMDRVNGSIVKSELVLPDSHDKSFN